MCIHAYEVHCNVGLFLNNLIDLGKKSVMYLQIIRGKVLD